MTTRVSSGSTIEVDTGHRQPGVLVLRYHGSHDQGMPGSPEIDSLCDAFDAIQRSWDDIVAAGTAGRIVVIAPASAALGEPTTHWVDAAVTGGLISLVRSLAIELSKYGGTANTLLIDPAASSSATGLILAALTAPDASDITGQELYTAGPLSTGRLHP